MKFVGIDPGKEGGISCLDDDGTLTLHTIPKIGDEVDVNALNEIIEQYVGNSNHIFALEDVKPFPGTSAMSMGKLMEIKGIKRGILIANKATYVMVPPKTWQKVAWSGVPNMKKSNMKNDTKGMSLVAASRIFPNEKFLATSRSRVPHDGLVDAALMSFYLKSTYGK